MYKNNKYAKYGFYINHYAVFSYGYSNLSFTIYLMSYRSKYDYHK